MFSGGNKNFIQNKRENSCQAYVLNNFKESKLYIIIHADKTNHEKRATKNNNRAFL